MFAILKFGVFQNLCEINFQLQEVKSDVLPGALPAGGKVTLRFPVPNGADEAGLVVLFWNGAEWVEVPGGKALNGFFEADAAKPGIYVLASK